MAVRGLLDPGEIESFLQLNMASTHDPGRLPGVDTAADRLVEGIRAGESIAICGDYDADPCQEWSAPQAYPDGSCE
ncbi:MAG: hypothetical protein CMJ24_00355, partial [Phycisphaerae bacterium]|nr:hypothetical protein [Phycisphaerae bacterium]